MKDETRHRLDVLMCDVDDYDPEDHVAELRSNIAKALDEATTLLAADWPEEAEVVAKIAIQVLEGN